ncbi:hypothetical protein [Vibrio rhodolitus]|uniref:hypothetical protein n=1 Tax=Vibrio rhodolitus TaxID=2231649 RepID=UPI000E0AA190|nr:hypothetical protein [Vibrio rhodolitus]
MNLSTESEAKLANWANTDTWHSNHDLDLHRFFKFINQYANDHGHLVDESILKDKIASMTNTPTGNDNTLEDIIRKRISLMVEILDFFKCNGQVT